MMNYGTFLHSPVSENPILRIEIQMNQDEIIQSQVDEELIAAGYHRFYLYIISDAFAVILFTIILWNKMSNHSIFILWLSLMIVLNHLSRFIFLWIYHSNKNHLTLHHLSFWKKYFIINHIQSGILWALGGLLFVYIPDPLYRLIIFLYLTGILGATLGKLPSYHVCYIGFTLPISITLLILSVSITPSLSIYLLLTTILYIFMLLASTSSAHSLLLNSVRLKLYNINLLGTLRHSEENFRNTIDYAPIGTAILSLDGKYLHVNQTMRDLLGYSDKELFNMTLLDTTHADAKTSLLEIMKKLMQGEVKIAHVEKRYIRKDGGTIWSMISLSLIRDGEGNPQNFIIQIIDVSDRVKYEEKMVQLNEKTLEMLKELKQLEYEENLLNKLNNMLQICLTLEEAYPRINIIAQDLFKGLSGGLSIYNKLNQNMETVLQWGDDQLLQAFFLSTDCLGLRAGSISIVEDPTKSVPCTHYISHPQGGYMIIPLIVQDDTIGVIHLLAPATKVIPTHMQEQAVSFSNIVKLALANLSLRASLHELSMHDPLTGLFNRRFLNETLKRELFRLTREKSNLTVTMLDIDDFKKFNDTLGHDAGDEVLKNISNMLTQQFRGSDISCRFGGEEFVVVMLRSDGDSSARRMDQFREKIKNTSLFYNGDLLPNVTVSIGIAEAPLHGIIMEDILKAADQALYDAKKAGKDRVVIYHSKSSENSLE
jgi:diguanylate cyclase (GGDEF)-like protein/PAS domain S-box-containing protein